MSVAENVFLRPVEPADLDAFFDFQRDPQAIHMAAFVGRDPSDKPAFLAHWNKILHTDGITNRTVLADGRVAGSIACYPDGGRLEVTYWIGREFWGRGTATAALQLLLELIPNRPLFARVATDNMGSLKVLEKCGFKVIGSDSGFAHGRGEETAEAILRLDPRVIDFRLDAIGSQA